MDVKIKKNKLKLLIILLFLPFLVLTSCQEEIKINALDTPAAFSKDSKIVSLIESALNRPVTSIAKSDDDDNDNNDDDDDDDDDTQCVQFVYPIAFFAIFSNSQSIETIVINNDNDLFAFFDNLTSGNQIRIDFPLSLIGTNGQETTVNSLAELESVLQVAVDACRDDDGNDDDDYEYCNDDETKVYICHNGNTICVSINAIQAHLDHGDELGQCDDNNDDDNDDGNNDDGN